MSIVETNCPFCGQKANQWAVQNTHNYFGYDCHICGAYFLSWGVIERLKKIAGSQQILNCVSENISSNTKFGEEIKTSWHLRSETQFPAAASNITRKYLEDFLDVHIDHASKSWNLLFVLANKAQKSTPFSDITLDLKDLYYLKIADANECATWLRQLYDSKLIDSVVLKSNTIRVGFTNDQLQHLKIQITVQGWQAIQKEQSKSISRKVFIAMQFDWGNEELNVIRTKYIEAIQAGCADCGYEANLVSQNHTGYITDRIISEIKISKFVIADFTFNNQGAYYEAGLARGLGKKVIHTVMNGHISDPTDKFKQLHFDIKQINYIEWSNPVELRTRIADRIRSTIEGE